MLLNDKIKKYAALTLAVISITTTGCAPEEKFEKVDNPNYADFSDGEKGFENTVTEVFENTQSIYEEELQKELDELGIEMTSEEYIDAFEKEIIENAVKSMDIVTYIHKKLIYGQYNKFVPEGYEVDENEGNLDNLSNKFKEYIENEYDKDLEDIDIETFLEKRNKDFIDSINLPSKKDEEGLDLDD